MMIDDDDIALGRAAPHLGDEAALVFFALLAETGVCASVELVPEGAGFGQFREFGAVAGLRRFFPGGDCSVVFDLFQSAERRLVSEVKEFLAAQIVVASLHVTEVQLAVSLGEQRSLQPGYIFEEKLLLQILRTG